MNANDSMLGDEEVDVPMALSQTLGGALPRGRAARSPAVDAAGDAAALAALYRAHHEEVFRTAWRVTGDAQDAEDVLQTVFLRLARTGRAAPDNPGGYLHRAAVNAALDLVRGRKRRPAVPLETPGGLRLAEEASRGRAVGDGAPARGATPEAHELRDRLRAALAEMHPRTAEVFALRYLEGFGNREIAELLGTTESTIGVTLFRARKQLRERLGDAGGEEVDGG